MDFLSVLFPRRCIGCGEIGSYLCPNCVNRFQPIKELYCPYCRHRSHWGHTHIKCKGPYAIDGLISCYPYYGLMKKTISKFKYSLVHDLTLTLIELFTSDISHPVLFSSKASLVPVPLHSVRLKWRGFNQAEVLATHLGKCWNMPVKTGWIIRKKPTMPQMKLSGKERRVNLKGAFEVIANEKNLSNILLVDDVATTCSTLIEAGETLKKAGAKEVWGLTLAQAIPSL